MKILSHKILLVILFSFFYCIIYSQCPSGNLNIESQQDIDLFKVNYPNCTEINFDLAITNNSNQIQNLDGLSNITSVKGNFFIVGINNSININGLSLLNSIEGD